jgi:nitrogen-specific signal transduction histidine kinase
MSTTFDKLPPIWQDAYTKLNHNTILQQMIETIFNEGEIDNFQTESFFNGEIEQQFMDSSGMTTEQIMKAQRGEQSNIIDLINQMYEELSLSKNEYKYTIYQKNENLVEITITEIQTGKFMLIEFTHDENNLVNEVFISKNNLFYGDKHKKIFEIFTSEAYIDFVIKSEIEI